MILAKLAFGGVFPMEKVVAEKSESFYVAIKKLKNF